MVIRVAVIHFFRMLFGNCNCTLRKRKIGESDREWIKETSCMYHWMKSKYYKDKFKTKQAHDL